ncbi:hypothetical protein PF003_g23472 [Phytophthora fragariae]|nr:hypothetical protein PF003_g23472 [Phytophthora fragariae]
MVDDSPADPPRPASLSGGGARAAGQQDTPAAPASSVSHSDTPTSAGASISAPSRASSTRVDTPVSSVGLPAATSTPLAVLGAAQVSVGTTSTTEQPVTVTGLPTSMTLSCEKSDLQDQILASTREVKQLQEFQDLRDKRIAELEAELAGVQKFSAAALMDFLAGSTNLSGHWKRLLELLQHYQEGHPIPTQFRTMLQVSARDEDSDDCGPYVLQESKTPVPSSSSTGGGSAQAPRPRTPLTPLSGPSPKSATSGSSSRKMPRLSLSGTPPPQGASKSHHSASQGSGSGDQATIDLTHSSTSTPSSTRVMLYVDRLKLAQRPRKFKPDKTRAMNSSPSRVSEAKAMKAVPSQFLWMMFVPKFGSACSMAFSFGTRWLRLVRPKCFTTSSASSR